MMARCQRRPPPCKDPPSSISEGALVRKRTPALIFDFGNVVAHFDYRKACETLGRPHGLSGEAFLERARRLGFSPLIHQYESGAISSKAFSRGVCALVGL